MHPSRDNDVRSDGKPTGLTRSIFVMLVDHRERLIVIDRSSVFGHAQPVNISLSDDDSLP